MDPKNLRKHYMHAVPKLNNALKYVQDQLSDLPPSEFELETNVKPYTSVRRKMESLRTKDPLELSDLVRGRLFYSPQFKAEDTLDIVKKLFNDKVANVNNGAHRSKEHGLEYHGVVHVQLDVDGIKFELQLMPKEFKPYNEFLHQIYEKFRNPKTHDKLSDKQKELLRKLHNNLFKKLDKQADDDRANS